MINKILYISPFILLIGTIWVNQSHFQETLIGEIKTDKIENDYTPDIKFHGIQIRVHDMDKAIEFYHLKMGFPIKSKKDYPNEVVLETVDTPLILHKVKNTNPTDFVNESSSSVAFQVNKLLPAIDDFRQKGIAIKDNKLERNGVGVSIPFLDPSGNEHHLIEVQVYEVPEFKEPKIYNCGFSVSDMVKAEAFYLDILGFEPYSRKYLSAALPLKHKDQSFAFMLHHGKESKLASVNYPEDAQTLLLFETKDIKGTYQYLKEHKIKILTNKIQSSKKGKYIAIQDPVGNVSEVWEFKK